ncbi:MAG: hydroxymethylbilane synthase [Eubacteriales bacterium]|nr:hydroxymethylbilane synthase [Eubacteriales bacterium]
MKKKVIIGSRESRLAVIQSEMVQAAIRESSPELEVEILTMKTTGDKILDRTLDQIGGKGLFVKELDRALLEKRTDLSVHSLKDMPMEVKEQLPLVAFSKREDPRDVLVLPEGASEIDFSLPIGCASRRRVLQLKKLYPQASFAPVRGNVQTRLAKLDSGQYSALILAAAGLKRLGLTERISRYFTVDEMIPAAGQGILGLQGRDDLTYEYLEAFHSAEAADAAAAERSFVKILDGGCSSPVAAHAEIDGEELLLRGLYYDEETDGFCTGSLRGNRADAEELGRRLAEQLSMKYQKKAGEDAAGSEERQEQF